MNRAVSQAYDPITVEVIRNRLISIVLQMAAVMERTAYTIIFSEFKDFSCAVCDGELRMVATSVSDFGCPMHTGGMPLSLQAIADTIGLENIRPGDILCTNDVEMGGTHLPDFVITQPVFFEGELVAFTLNRAHHMDTGGATPGSAVPDARSIYAEGISVPPIKLYSEGKLNRDIFELILRNVRLKEQRGDFAAMVASVKRGAAEIEELIGKYGIDTYRQALKWAYEYSEKRLKSAIKQLPEGVYYGESFGEHDGLQDKDYLINLKVEVQDGEIVFDFSGSDPQAPGSSNCTLSITAAAAMTAAIAVLDPYVPINFGVYKPLKFVTPYGSITNCIWPAATMNGNTDTSNKIIDAVFRVFMQIVPDKVCAAEHSCTNSAVIYGVDKETREQYMLYSSAHGGWGGKKGKDGHSATDFLPGGTAQLLPVEVMEAKSRAMTKSMRILTDSGGPGQWRGGSALEWTVMTDPERPHTAEVTVIAERRRIPAWGAMGGRPGIEQLSYVVQKDGSRKILPTKGHFFLEPGEIMVLSAPGAGGYGDPLERKPEAVLRDVVEGFVSVESAREDYGVIIDPSSLTIDWEETSATRARKTERGG
ncbi:MAG: hydantoinase B/oxoprolinase family protein [Chloroflexi bacterium]|nr:hydantoinase B/oxoprolinase family protein [Chloroflexota bacterium]